MTPEDIVKAYKFNHSIKEAMQECHCSWNRVVKTLSTQGIIINETHMVIMDLHNKGLSADQISNQTGLNFKTVQSYLPATRPFYGSCLSENAKRIKKCREKSKSGRE